MFKMNKFTYILTFLFAISVSHSQTKTINKHIGGPCEGCEAIYEYGDKKLANIDTLPAFKANEPKILITGTVFKKDQKTPAENVVLYIYHTNKKGIYETKGDEKGWAKRHGYIRGWVKTGSDGRYKFYTFRPASYPNRKEQEHIHIIVKEPNINDYYIDSYVFDDDPLLTDTKRNKLKKRGGTGIVKPKFENGILTVKRDIILGLNIPNYD
jgi:protocatechuate 3,4-dioxygenase beta subunit